jgi:apolipoprotein D and lipocalin family protein
MTPRLTFGTLFLALAFASSAQTPPSLQPLPDLDVAAYMGTWYQVLWVPNRFQRQCVADTTATYRDLGDGTLAVTNRCRQADGTVDGAMGLARPVTAVSDINAGKLRPARLEVSFLPAWLRWTGIGWGAYWVIDLAPDGRYAIISESSREYLWVLSRKPALTSDDDKLIRDRLQVLGFDLSKVQVHSQSPARAPATNP